MLNIRVVVKMYWRANRLWSSLIKLHFHSIKKCGSQAVQLMYVTFTEL